MVNRKIVIACDQNMIDYKYVNYILEETEIQ